LLCVLYAALFVLVSGRGFWADPFSYPRAFSPLIGLIAWQGVTAGAAWRFLPWLVVLLRVGWQLGPQALGVIQAALR
jgi:hypothetical protein